MFFKKKKDMSESNNDNTTRANENTDKLSQNENMDEVLANILNTDDSISAKDLVNEGNDEEIEKLQAEIAELKDRHLRQIAEFENFRRRQAKEKVELIQTAGRDIIESLLVVLDDVDRAEKQQENSTDTAAIKEGIALVFSKLRSILHQKGLRKMDATGEDFNADLHEAITEIPMPGKEGKVVDVLESGYYLNDKLIRFAKVIVGKEA